MEELFSLFVDYIDSIYYKGYAEQLAKENPQLYSWEFKEFCWIHEPKNTKAITGDLSRGNCKIIKLPLPDKNSSQRA